MRQAIAIGVLASLLLVSVPVAGQTDTDTQTSDEPRCVSPPDLNESYEWEYNLLDSGKRYISVQRASFQAQTTYGVRNLTKFSFSRYDAQGELKERGTSMRMSSDSTWGQALMQESSKVWIEGEQIQRIESFDPPFMINFRGSEICPGDFWDFTTNHSIYARQQGHQGQSQSADEHWDVKVHNKWQNITVEAGTFDVLPVQAIRANDGFSITSYYAPEAKAFAKRVHKNPNAKDGASKSVQELSWYILNQRPTAKFRLSPEKPQVGDEITLNGTVSFDPDGEITRYRWAVGDRTYEGPIVKFNATETGVIHMKLFVTDDNNRTRVLQGSVYVEPEEGSAVTVDGPTQAPEGRIVTLRAYTSFDSDFIRWRAGDEVVGRGQVYRFYMNETTTLQVDATTKQGRTYTDNHTVTLVERPEGEGGNDTRREHPPGSSSLLSILRPLEGQVISSSYNVELVSQTEATLEVDGRTLWQGSAEAGTSVPVELEPGQRTLRLEGTNKTFVVNVTVSSDTVPGAGAGGGDDSDPSQAGGNDSSPGRAPTPAVGPVAVLVGCASIALARRRS